MPTPIHFQSLSINVAFATELDRLYREYSQLLADYSVAPIPNEPASESVLHNPDAYNDCLHTVAYILRALEIAHHDFSPTAWFISRKYWVINYLVDRMIEHAANPLGKAYGTIIKELCWNWEPPVRFKPVDANGSIETPHKA